MPLRAPVMIGRRAWAAVTALFCLLLPGLCGCHPETTHGKTFRFPLAGEPRQLDPQVSADAVSLTVVNALFEGLTRLDENGKAVAGAAEWSVSADGKTYTFVLTGSKWSNGMPVTAQDFVFGLQRAVMPGTKSALAARAYGIVNAKAIHEGKQNASTLGVKATGVNTLVITLAAADPSFPEKAAQPPFMPCNAAFFEGTQGRYGLEVEYILSNGPFQLTRWTHDQQLVLEKNPGYHDAASIYPGTVRYMIKDYADPVGTLAAGGLDAAELTPAQTSLAADKGIEVVSLPDSIQSVWMNNRVAALSSPAVRRALRDAIDWQLLYEALNADHDTPAVGYIAPAAVIAQDERYRREANAQRRTTDISRARQELEQGLADAQLESKPKLTLLCAEDAYSRQLALYIVQSWQNLSLYFTIEAVGADVLVARVNGGNYQLALYTATTAGDTALDACGAFVSAASGNLARFTDSEYDRMYQQTVMNPSRANLEKLEARLQQQCPAIPIAFANRYYGIAPLVSGVRVRPFGGGVYGAPIDFRQAEKREE